MAGISWVDAYYPHSESGLRFCHWAEDFLSSAAGKKALDLLEDTFEDKRSEKIPWYSNKEESVYLALEGNTLRACYLASTYPEVWEKEHKHLQEGLKGIDDKGRNPLKALEEIRNFNRRYHRISGAALSISGGETGVWLKDMKDDTAEHWRLFDKLLDGYYDSLKRQASYRVERRHKDRVFYAGCLCYSELPPRLRGIRTNSLVHHLAHLFQWWLRSENTNWWSNYPYSNGEPFLHKSGTPFYSQQISLFVSATLGENLSSSIISERIEYLREKRVRLRHWQHAHSL